MLKRNAISTRNGFFQDQQLALEFLAEMDSAIRQKVRVGDYQFLAVELSTIRGGLAGEPVDPFDLTVNLEVQELIREVARSFPGNFLGIRSFTHRCWLMSNEPLAVIGCQASR